MRAEVISIGDELTSGQRLDTNSQWLSERLGELGVTVMFHTTVADDLEANILVFRQACERAEIVVCTGGLGPTADDLTRQALADMLGLELVQDDQALAHIQALFARRKRPMPPSNLVQALFPRGSRVIPNPHGSAPGIDLDVPRQNHSPARVFALPGVPAEMKEMWQQTVAPAITARMEARRVVKHHRIKCFGVGESDLEALLPDLIRRGRFPTVGITVSQATITLRITASAETPEAALQAMQPTVATIHECLGELAYGEEEEELQDIVLRQLAIRGQTLAVVEVGSGGAVTNWLNEVGQPATFCGGVVVNAAATMARLMDPELPEATSADTDPTETVAILARRCRERFGVDFALAIGPFPPLVPGSDPGFVHFAIVAAAGVVTRSTPFAGHPDLLKTRAAKQALDFLRLHLLHSPKSS